MHVDYLGAESENSNVYKPDYINQKNLTPVTFLQAAFKDMRFLSIFLIIIMFYGKKENADNIHFECLKWF